MDFDKTIRIVDFGLSILFAMVCGCLPFEDKDTPKLYKKILNGEY